MAEYLTVEEALALCDWNIEEPFENHVTFAHGIACREDVVAPNPVPDDWQRQRERYFAWRVTLMGAPQEDPNDDMFQLVMWHLWFRLPDTLWRLVMTTGGICGPDWEPAPANPDGTTALVVPYGLSPLIVWGLMKHMFHAWINRLNGISYEDQKKPTPEEERHLGRRGNPAEGCTIVYEWMHEPTCSLLPPKEIRKIEPPPWVASHQEDTPENRSFWKRMGFGKYRTK
jgi:hypothetical protein